MSTVFVCGLGRCGSSLVMQMLHRGGFPTVGEWPAFEPAELGPCVDVRSALLFCEGKAGKLLDPHKSHHWTEDAPVGLKVILLTRNSREQAKSQVKFLRLVGGFGIPGQAWRGMESAIRREIITCRNLFEDREIPILQLTFEEILKSPLAVAKKLAAFVDHPLDIERMANAVIPRTPGCSPDVSIELTLIEQGGSK